MVKSFEARVVALERTCVEDGDACPEMASLRQVVRELEEAHLRRLRDRLDTLPARNPDHCRNDGAPGTQ
jgi:hypothetical protein